MQKGAVVEDRGGEGIGTVDEDGAATQGFEHGDRNRVAAPECYFCHRSLRRGVKVEDEVSLGAPAGQDGGVCAGW